MHLTKSRLDLLREVQRGNVWTVAGTGRAFLRTQGDREISSRVDWLRHVAKLVEIDPDDADLDVQGFALTDEGRTVLADAKD